MPNANSNLITTICRFGRLYDESKTPKENNITHVRRQNIANKLEDTDGVHLSPQYGMSHTDESY